MEIKDKSDAIAAIQLHLERMGTLPLALGILHDAYDTICREMHAETGNNNLRLFLNGVLIVDVDR